MSRKIAIVVQRYGLEINGGAEYHARLIAERLSKYFAVEVFTTTACDYVTWDHHYRSGLEILNGIPVHRFPVEKPRDPEIFGRMQQHIFEDEHFLEDELSWLEEEGPLVPKLIQKLEKREKEFAYFIFFSYRYYHSFYGVSKFSRKAILVPTAEHDQVIYLSLFKDFFNLPAAIVYNSWEEKWLINRISGNAAVCGDVVGVGSEIPDRFDPQGACARLGIEGRYFVYIGRLDENKGVPELFDFYLRLLAEEKTALHIAVDRQSHHSHPGAPPYYPCRLPGKQNKIRSVAGCGISDHAFAVRIAFHGCPGGLGDRQSRFWPTAGPKCCAASACAARPDCGTVITMSSRKLFSPCRPTAICGSAWEPTAKSFFWKIIPGKPLTNKYLKIIAALDQRQ